MQVGSVIMNADVLESDERVLTVFRENEQLQTNAAFFPGDMLQVKISESKNEYVYEVENAEFDGGGCEGTRIANKPIATLLLPIGQAASQPVKIRVGWAEGHSTVKVSKDFMLLPSSLKSQKESKPVTPVEEVAPKQELTHHNVTSAMEAAAKVFVNKQANFLRKRQQAEDAHYIPSTDKQENSLISEKEGHQNNVPSVAAVLQPSLDTKTGSSSAANRPSLMVAAGMGEDRPSLSIQEPSPPEEQQTEEMHPEHKPDEYPEEGPPPNMEYPEEHTGNGNGDHSEEEEAVAVEKEEGEEQVPELTRKPRTLSMKVVDFERLQGRVWRYLLAIVAMVLLTCYLIFLYRISLLRLIRKLFNRPRFVE